MENKEKDARWKVMVEKNVLSMVLNTSTSKQLLHIALLAALDHMCW